MHRESLNIDEFVANTLVVLENNNLDPVFDYSQADEAAQKIIDEIFNDENAGKKLSEIISENQLHEEDLIYTKKGIFPQFVWQKLTLCGLFAPPPEHSATRRPPGSCC